MAPTTGFKKFSAQSSADVDKKLDELWGNSFSAIAAIEPGEDLSQNHGLDVLLFVKNRGNNIDAVEKLMASSRHRSIIVIGCLLYVLV